MKNTSNVLKVFSISIHLTSHDFSYSTSTAMELSKEAVVNLRKR